MDHMCSFTRSPPNYLTRTKKNKGALIYDLVQVCLALIKDINMNLIISLSIQSLRGWILPGYKADVLLMPIISVRNTHRPSASEGQCFKGRVGRAI